MFWLGRRRDIKKSAKELYTSLLYAALAPRLFEAGAGIDTFEGRAAILTAHATILVGRLKEIEDRKAVMLADAVNTLILDEFDAAYRERGVGDSSIARKVRKLAEAHYGLGAALTVAFDAGPAALENVLLRNGVTIEAHAASVARYLANTRDSLNRQSDAAIMSGKVRWPGYP